MVEKLLVFEVVSSSFFMFLSLVAQPWGLKLAINLLNSKDVDEALRLHLNVKVLRLGMLGSALGSIFTRRTNFVKIGCSQYNVTDVNIFHQNLNATFQDLKAQIGNQSKHFATAQAVKGNNPAYALFQCRNYLSISDCLKCFDFAADHIRNCSVGVTGARIIYEGCFL
ncbi:plasmodesmata-located protein 7-like, partial [Prosopis cineraria]|uniref:plasmodesmata-located protein 7-like n=1 Tax=Prosopis cineraria TaxID=364024 RepID=UPI00240FC6EF